MSDKELFDTRQLLNYINEIVYFRANGIKTMLQVILDSWRKFSKTEIQLLCRIDKHNMWFKLIQYWGSGGLIDHALTRHVSSYIDLYYPIYNNKASIDK